MIFLFLIRVQSCPATLRSSQAIRSAVQSDFIIFGVKSCIFPMGVGIILSIPVSLGWLRFLTTERENIFCLTNRLYSITITIQQDWYYLIKLNLCQQFFLKKDHIYFNKYQFNSIISALLKQIENYQLFVSNFFLLIKTLKKDNSKQANNQALQKFVNSDQNPQIILNQTQGAFGIFGIFQINLLFQKCSNIYTKTYPNSNPKNYQLNTFTSSQNMIQINIKFLAMSQSHQSKDLKDQSSTHLKVEEKLEDDCSPILPKQTQSGKNQTEKKKSYNVVTYQMRVKLINLSGKKGYSISRAARELGIKPSTGKFIVKSFRDEGKIMKKICPESVKESQAGETIMVSKNDLPFKRKTQKTYGKQCFGRQQMVEPFQSYRNFGHPLGHFGTYGNLGNLGNIGSFGSFGSFGSIPNLQNEEIKTPNIKCEQTNEPIKKEQSFVNTPRFDYSTVLNGFSCYNMPEAQPGPGTYWPYEMNHPGFPGYYYPYSNYYSSMEVPMPPPAYDY